MNNNKKCLFCKIINNEIESKNIIEDENAICILDINPKELGHALIIPKKHSDSFSKTSYLNHINVIILANKYIELLKKSSVKPDGFNIITNEGEIAGQEIFHYHLHVIPRFSKKSNLNIDELYDELMLISNKK